jgi:hypothetical protein
VDHVVKVLVVRKDDVAADVKEEALVGGVGGGEAACLLVGVDEQPWAVVLCSESEG